MPEIRMFIAIDLSSDLRNQLTKISNTLQKTIPNVKWVPSKNIHLTLKFLGNVHEKNIQNIIDSLNSLLPLPKQFEISLSGLGVFPDKRNPRVIWAGVQAPTDLIILYKTIEKSMISLGFPAEKRSFSPHLTIGRTNRNFRNDNIEPLINSLQKYKEHKIGKMMVTSIHLFKSDLKPSGAVYTSLFNFDLCKPDQT